MSFLVALLASLLEWLIAKLAVIGIAKAKEVKDNQAIEDRAKADAEALKKAKTDKEREDAARRIADHTFGP